MFNIGLAEIVLVLLIAFLVVGPKDLPKVARWLGRNIKRARAMMNELKKELGWSEVEKEFTDVKQEIEQTAKKGDVTEEIRSVSSDLKKQLEQAKQLNKDKKY